MRKTIGMVLLGLGGLAAAIGLTVGALAIAGDDVGSVVQPTLESPSSGSSAGTPSSSPSVDDRGDDDGTPTASPSVDDHGGDGSGSDDPSGSDDHSGSGSGSGSGSNSGSGSDNSGSGSDDD
jgi:hypothetical protein